jgi:hypothetical protein
MPKDDGLQKHTLNLRVGDMEKIKEYYPDVPASNIIRMIVSRFIDQIEAGAEQTANVEIKL